MAYADYNEVSVMTAASNAALLLPAPTEAARGLAVTEADGAFDNGIDFALVRLCAFLGVDKYSVDWDAATETVEGDVSSVIGNILRAHFGEDWGPNIPYAALCTSPPETVGGGELPSQEQMNQAFYVDVCRAEDRLKEFIATARTLLAVLPDHWHDDATVNLIDLCDETDAILNPHMHTPYQVRQAQKSYGADRVVPVALPSAPPAEETWQAIDENTPRDGTWVLWWAGYDVHVGGFDEGRWYSAQGFYVREDEPEAPTHWRALPPAPAGEAK